jgi:hypothetical protein
MASASSFEKVSPSPDSRPLAQRPPLAEVPNRARPTASPAFKESIKGDSKISLPPARSVTEPGAPTLNHKRSRGPSEPSRQKSSKRRAEEMVRLRELREMSSPIPVPRPPRRASAQPTGTTTQGGSTRNLQRPMSEVSLPLAESIRSSFSGTLEQLSSSYRISPFDALSPHPTIRYSDHPQRLSEGGTPSRSVTRKEKSPAIMEEGDFGPRARIKDLADDLDARALRQVMEREQRRKERKAKAKLEKLERESRRQEATSKRHATPSTAQDQLNDVQMRDAEEAGPSTAPGTAREESPSPLPKQRRSPPPEPTQSPSSWLQDPSEESLRRDAPSPMDTNGNDDKEEPVLETAQAVRLSSANMAPPSSNETKSTTEQTDAPPAASSNPPPPPPKSIARELARDSITEKPTENRRDSESGGASRLMAIFRRSGTKQRGSSDKSRGTPSEFSNTSRESFVRQQKAAAAAAASASPAAGSSAAVPALPRSFTPQKTIVTSTTPRHTKSKFREDLPDFPISPPSSRNSRLVRPDSPVSPASPTSPYIDDHSKVETMNDEDRVTTPIGNVHPALRGDMNRDLGQSPRSISPEGPSAALSQSLASVDSEGSWLSGRLQKRSSIPITTLREGGGSISEHVGETSGELPAEKDPSYFARREPADRPTLQASGLTSQLARGLQTPSGLGEIPPKQQSPTDGEPKEGRITGHRPMVVQSGGSHRSREGLVMETAGDDASPRSQKAEIEGGSEDSQRPSPDRRDSGPEADVSVQQATSVDLNRGASHSRRVSAGSARILDIPPRVPGDKRNSTLSFGSSVPSPGIPQRTFEDAEADEGSDAAKNQQSVGVRSSLGPGQAPGLGLGLRIGSRNASDAADEKDAHATSGNAPRRTSVDE